MTDQDPKPKPATAIPWMCFSELVYTTVEMRRSNLYSRKLSLALIVMSFRIHLGKVTLINEHYFRSGLNCACCFKWHTKEEHQLWDWLWLRNIHRFPKQSIVPLLPCHCPSPSSSNNFLLNTEGETAEKKEGIPIWNYRGTFKKQGTAKKTEQYACLLVHIQHVIQSSWGFQAWFLWGQPSLNTETLAGEEK